MKILWHLDRYVPWYNAGSEVMTAIVNDFLISKGHTVTVITDNPRLKEEDAPNGYVTGKYGEKVYVNLDLEKDLRKIHSLYHAHDVIMTQLDAAPFTIKLANKMNKPIVYWQHIRGNLTRYGVQNHTIDMMVYNSEWIKKATIEDGFSFKEDCVCIPPTPLEMYRTEDGHRRFITLVNGSADKGGHLFLYLAKMRPQYDFLLVKGAYGEQLIRKLPNLYVFENTPDIRDVMKVTKVLLTPSKRETWGRIAVEAMCSGIPVVSGLTEGLLEALGPAAVFADRDKPDVWLKVIDQLMSDQEFYEQQRIKSIDRATMLDKKAFECLVQMELKLDGLIHSKKRLLLPVQPEGLTRSTDM